MKARVLLFVVTACLGIGGALATPRNAFCQKCDAGGGCTVSCSGGCACILSEGQCYCAPCS
jgi:hypothetical protein